MTTARKHTKRPSPNHRLHSQEPTDRARPFIEHVHELRRRISYIALSVAIFGAAAYAVERQIVSILLRPAHGQQFIYTSPGGGIDFLFRVCLYIGLIGSIPVIIYQLLRYIEPLIKKESVHFIAWGSAISGVLAIAGVIYGYFWGLPAALHFLLHQFVTKQIQPLVTIQSYMSFVMVYMVGSALLFQVPLVLIFINRIKPLKPQRLFHYERHVIAGALLMAAIMNPTPNVFALMLLAGPIILMYQVGIALIWYYNRGKRPSPQLTALREQDTATREAQAQRLQQQYAPAAPTASPSNEKQKLRPVHVPAVATAVATVPARAISVPATRRPQQYVTASVRRQFAPAQSPRVISDFRLPPARTSGDPSFGQ